MAGGFSLPDSTAQRTGTEARLQRMENPVASFGGGADAKGSPQFGERRFAGDTFRNGAFARRQQEDPKGGDDWMGKFMGGPDGRYWAGIPDEPPAASSEPEKKGEVA